MDEKFKVFEMWFQKRKTVWEQKGIFVEAAGLRDAAHQYYLVFPDFLPITGSAA